MEKLTFITGNHAKAKYLSDYFDLSVEHRKIENLHEIQSLNLDEIVKEKTKAAFKIIKSPVLVEDVSLVFKAYKELPGPLIKWFLETLGNQGLCDLLKDKDKSAFAKVSFCYCDGKNVKVFSGEREGSIAKKPQGELRFGWDPIFIPKGYTETWAEMSADEKHQTSMRKIALKKLKKYLKSAAGDKIGYYLRRINGKLSRN